MPNTHDYKVTIVRDGAGCLSTSECKKCGLKYHYWTKDPDAIDKHIKAHMNQAARRGECR